MRNGMHLMALIVMCASTRVLAGGDPGETWQEAVSLSEERPAQDITDLTKAFVSKKNASVRILIDVLQNAKLPKTNRIAAAKILGELRAPEAVDALIQQLTLSPELVDEKTQKTVYPCYHALINIGVSAGRKALDHLRDEDDHLRKRLLCGIIKEVEGQSVTVFLLESELQKSQSVKAKQNIQDALKMLSEK